MSGPSVGGGGRGDPFGNIFGGGGDDKQVYPPAPPGYKYVDLNIPQAPPGYSVAKMSSIANNQSAPVTSGALGGNAGLGGRGTGGRTTFQFGAHTPEGIRERAAALLTDRAMRANTLNELQGLAPQYQIPGQPAPAAPSPYGGGAGYRPPPSALISGTPSATVNPGPGNVTLSMMPGTPMSAPAAAPVGAPASPYGQPLAPIPGFVRKQPAFHSQFPKGSVERARETLARQKADQDAMEQAQREALGLPPLSALPPVATRPVAAPNASVTQTPGPSPAAQPPAAPPNSTSYANQPVDQSGIRGYVPDVLLRMWDNLNQPPVPQSHGIIPPNAITAPDPTAAPVPAQTYNPLDDGREEDQ